jgi:hypothetical protein
MTAGTSIKTQFIRNAVQSAPATSVLTRFASVAALLRYFTQQEN